MPTTKAGQRAVNKYMKENYDRINLTVPKGQKDIIKADASKYGLSVNQFIIQAIDQFRGVAPPISGKSRSVGE